MLGFFSQWFGITRASECHPPCLRDQGLRFRAVLIFFFFLGNFESANRTVSYAAPEKRAILRAYVKLVLEVKSRSWEYWKSGGKTLGYGDVLTPPPAAAMAPHFGIMVGGVTLKSSWRHTNISRAQIDLRKARERELAPLLDEKSTSSGIAEPYARLKKSEGENRGGRRDDTCDHGLSRSWK